MIDPLSSIVSLLQPQVRFSKVVRAAGSWRISREDVANPFYCVVLEGGCEFLSNDEKPINLVAGDFVLVPESVGFTFTSSDCPPIDGKRSSPVEESPGVFWVGEKNSPCNAHLLVGHCEFGAPDSAILVALLPKLVHIRHATRLTTLIELVIEESQEQRPGRQTVLSRLLEVLLIEAFRTKMDTPNVPGLLVGLADERLAIAIRKIHENVSHAWSVDQLAKEAALSRSVFFKRFRDALGFTPMEYVIAWRMAIAKGLLLSNDYTMADIAERIGYKSASAFSSAFSKYTGQSPSTFADNNDTRSSLQKA